MIMIIGSACRGKCWKRHLLGRLRRQVLLLLLPYLGQCFRNKHQDFWCNDVARPTIHQVEGGNFLRPVVRQEASSSENSSGRSQPVEVAPGGIGQASGELAMKDGNECRCTHRWIHGNVRRVKVVGYTTNSVACKQEVLKHKMLEPKLR